MSEMAEPGAAEAAVPAKAPIEGRVQRIFKAKAHPGRGDELAALLAEAGEGAGQGEGCELYLIARDPAEPDAVWVTEIWSSMEAAMAALKAPGVAERIEKVKALIADWGEGHELIPTGGLDVGARGASPAGDLDGAAAAVAEPRPGYTLANLNQVKDQAPDFGFEAIGEARFAREALDSTQSGFGLHRIKPGKRQAFGHSHDRAEEVYVVLSGAGRARLDDEILELTSLDALRVGPAVIRAFEAGPEGMEILVFGAHHPKDGELHHGWWQD